MGHWTLLSNNKLSLLLLQGAKAAQGYSTVDGDSLAPHSQECRVIRDFCHIIKFCLFLLQGNRTTQGYSTADEDSTAPESPKS